MAAISFMGTSPAVTPGAEISIARRHRRPHGEGIVDTRELARKLILKLVLAGLRPALETSDRSSQHGRFLVRHGLSKQTRMNFSRTRFDYPTPEAQRFNSRDTGKIGTSHLGGEGGWVQPGVLFVSSWASARCDDRNFSGAPSLRRA